MRSVHLTIVLALAPVALAGDDHILNNSYMQLIAGRGGHDSSSGGRSSSGYGAVRINGGGDSGRLEFEDYNGDWGTVCDRGFDREAPNVARKQLGYRRSKNHQPAVTLNSLTSTNTAI